MTDPERKRRAKEAVLRTIRERESVRLGTVLDVIEEAGVSRIEGRHAVLGYLSTGTVKTDIDLHLSVAGDPPATAELRNGRAIAG